MSEVEQRMDAGRDARGRATQGAVAEQLPNNPEHSTRVAKARRNAWLLAGLAVFFYVGYMAWMALRANGV